ncbi:MAG: tetratricopeptide repeat protein, partial [Planctomycetota bacterium]
MLSLRRTRSLRALRANGDSIQTNLSVSLAEACSGCSTQILLQRFVSCHACAGTGHSPGPWYRPATACPHCRGEGRIQTESLLTVNLPPTLSTGTQVRIPGEGHAGKCGGSPGDLIIDIEVLPHPSFQLDGTTLTGIHQISAEQAFAGGTLTLDLFGSPQHVTIPPGTHSGTWLELPGCGLPIHASQDDVRGLLKLRIDITPEAAPDTTPSDDHQPPDSSDSDESVTLAALPAELAAEKLLNECCGRLHAMPDQTPCAVCGKPTSDLLILPLQHRLFTCGVPLSVCATCSDQPPFTIITWPRWTKPLTRPSAHWIDVAICFWAGCLWLLNGLLSPIETPVHTILLLTGLLLPMLAMKGFLRLHALRQQQQTQTSQTRLQTLLKAAGLQPVFDDDPHAEVKLLHPTQRLQRPDAEPLDVFRQWLHLHQQSRLLFDEPERQRAGAGRALLDALILEVLRLQQQLLDTAPAGASEAFSAGLVLLPGNRLEVEVYAYSSARSISELQATMRQSLRSLPVVPVSAALPLLVYCCNRNGTPLQVRLPQPFQGWRKAQLTQTLPAGVGPSELAESIFGVQPDQRLRQLTAQQIQDWVTRGAPLLPLLTDESGQLVRQHADEPDNPLWQQRLSQLIQTFSVWYPTEPEIGFLHARCLGQMEFPERAAAVCQELLQRFPEFANAHGFLACLQYHLGRAQDAEVTLRSAPRSGLSIEFYLSITRLFRELDEPGKAAGYLNAAILRYPCESQLWIERAQLFAQIGHFTRALQDLDHFDRLAGVELQSVWLRGQWLLALGRHDDALSLYESAARQYPQNPLFLQLRAEALEEVGRSSEAVAVTTQVLEQAPDFLPARLLRIHSLIAEGSLAEALTEIDQLPELAGLAGEQHLLKGLVLHYRGDHEEALWHFDQACAVDDRPIIRCRRVEALWKLDRLEEALSELNLLLTELPDAAPLLVLRGRVHLRLGQPQQAAADFDRAMQLDPQNADALQGRAVVFIEEHQPELAMSLLDTALRIQPAEPNSLLARARLLWEDNELPRAEKDLTTLLDDTPEFVPALLFRGEVRLRRKHFDSALTDYNHALLT